MRCHQLGNRPGRQPKSSAAASLGQKTAHNADDRHVAPQPDSNDLLDSRWWDVAHPIHIAQQARTPYPHTPIRSENRFTADERPISGLTDN